MHELVHLIGGQSAICDADWGNVEEGFYNKTALEILTSPDLNHQNSESEIIVSKQKIKYDGIPFTKLVLNAYKNNVISASQLMRYLDISLDDIYELECEILLQSSFKKDL